MRLNDPLITSFVFEGKDYEIDLAFDNVLDVFDVFDDKELGSNEHAEICLALLLGESVKPNVDLWNHVYQEFLHVDQSHLIEYDRKGNPMPTQKENKKVYDFAKDAEYIYASFQQAYNINLFREQGKLHWQEFQALLNGLPDDTVMRKITKIRLWEPSKSDNAEYRTAMHDLQKKYALEVEVEKTHGI